MTNLILTGCTAAALFAGLATSQSPQAPATKKILKEEVDGLVRLLRQTAKPDGALGNGSCLDTARTLTAAGYCHRYYHAGDGPWIRRAINSLFTHRRADGAFGKGDTAVESTRWVLAALTVLDPDAHDSVVERGRSFLTAQGAPTSDPFQDRLQAISRNVRGQDDPLAAIGGIYGPVLGAVFQNPQRPDLAIAAESLVELVACQAVARGDDLVQTPSGATAWTDAQQRGFDFLATQQTDGVFGVSHGGQVYQDVGLTGIGLAALLTKPVALRSDEDQATIDSGLEWLRDQQNEDGSFSMRNVNYSTCAAVMAIAAAGQAQDAPVLDRAQKYLIMLQNVEGRGYAPSDRDFGSIGYGGDERGDLSNLQFAVDALRQTDLEQSHEAFAKALIFLQRTQNLQSVNDFKARVRNTDDGTWQTVEPGNDGGSAYYPGNSPAGYVELSDGTRVPRSYGSMTYALLKTYILCGLPADDARVEAAVAWIQGHWTLDVNPGVDPGLGQKAAYQGLYYYYMVMAQALDAVGLESLSPPEGEPIDWRAELRHHLTDAQLDDGSWVNAENGRWWEDQPMVCTVYSMLALARCGGRG